MVSTDDLMQEIERLRTENAQLRDLLRAHGIPLPATVQDADSTAESNASFPPVVTKGSPMTEKAALFLSLFQGRSDVFARRWEGKNGRAGYSPACRNEWKPSICLKPKGKCAECAHAEYCAYDAAAVESHLRGKAVLGVYPLLQDETCRFLAIDFDEESWRADVAMTVQAARESDIPCAVEISRSGNGAHLWIFFAEPVEAAKARRLGSILLTQAMKKHARLSFASYDRMFPNQDTMPKGGFGNLIALPLQPAAARQGGSLFVDERWQPYPDQWVYLSGVQKLNGAQIDILLTRLPAQPLGALRPEDEDSLKKPWLRASTEIKPEDVPPKVAITLADGLYIPIEGFSNRAQNQLKRIAAFRNPQFYRSQAMRMPVWNLPRVICCAEYRGNFLVLPRGCFDDVMNWMQENCISTELHDERRSGRSICASFNGELRDEQAAAFEALSAHDTGVLSATTAFGKTVIGAALIAEKKVSTLILVHRAQLMEQWKERLAQFLAIDDVLPPQPRRRGRQKKREIIGCYGAGRDTRSGMIDIAMLQSMGNSDEIQPWIHDYGMVIVDECHHVPAVSFEQVLKAVSAKYVYGLTATPKRQDGHHPILYMYLGSIRYQVDARLQAKKRPFAHLMIPRFSGMRFHLDENSKSPIKRKNDEAVRYQSDNEIIIQPLNVREQKSAGWHTFLYVAIGLVLGVATMYFLILPSSVAAEREKAQEQVRSIGEQLDTKTSTITTMQQQIDSLTEENTKLRTDLEEYVGTDGTLKTVDELLLGAVEYLTTQDAMATASHIENVQEGVNLEDTSDAFKALYQALIDKIGPEVALNYYNTGSDFYDKKDYEKYQKLKA